MRLKIIISCLILGLVLLATSSVLAAPPPLSGQISSFGSQVGFGTTAPLPTLIAMIIKSLLGILGLIFFVLILWGGWQYMTAAGEPDKVKKAKNTITYAVIGLVIIASAYAIANFVINNIPWGEGGTAPGGTPGSSTPPGTPAVTPPPS